MTRLADRACDDHYSPHTHVAAEDAGRPRGRQLVTRGCVRVVGELDSPISAERVADCKFERLVVRLNTLRSESRGLGCPSGLFVGISLPFSDRERLRGLGARTSRGPSGRHGAEGQSAPVSQNPLALGPEGAAVRPRDR